MTAERGDMLRRFMDSTAELGFGFHLLRQSRLSPGGSYDLRTEPEEKTLEEEAEEEEPRTQRQWTAGKPTSRRQPADSRRFDRREKLAQAHRQRVYATAERMNLKEEIKAHRFGLLERKVAERKWAEARQRTVDAEMRECSFRPSVSPRPVSRTKPICRPCSTHRRGEQRWLKLKVQLTPELCVQVLLNATDSRQAAARVDQLIERNGLGVEQAQKVRRLLAEQLAL